MTTRSGRAPRRRCRLAAAAIAAALCGAAVAQEETAHDLAPAWSVRSFLEDAGVDETSVFFVDYDATGTCWFATSSGLLSYDGYLWQRYGLAEGLPSELVRCVLVTSEGTLLVGTDHGAGAFDGERFEPVGPLAGPSVRRMVESSDGAIWFCCDRWPDPTTSAGLTRWRSGALRTWTTEDGLPSDYVSDFLETSSGEQFVLTDRGLAQLVGPDGDVELPLRAAGFEDDTYVWSMVESPRHGLLVGTDYHFYRRADGAWSECPGVLPHLRQPRLVASRDGEILGFHRQAPQHVVRFTERGFVPASAPLPHVQGGVQFLSEDPSGGIWIGGFDRLDRWSRRDQEWSILAGVGRPLLRDEDGGIWSRPREGGLVRRRATRVLRVDDGYPPVLLGTGGDVWMSHRGGVARWRDDAVDAFDLAELGLAEPRIACVDGAGTVWARGVDAMRKPLFAAFAEGRWRAVPIQDLDPGDALCGVAGDSASGVWTLLQTKTDPVYRLVRVALDEQREVPLPERAMVTQPPVVVGDPGGGVWIHGFFGLLKWTAGDAPEWESVADLPAPYVRSMRFLGGDAWVSCDGNIGGQTAVLRRRAGAWELVPHRKGSLIGKPGEEDVYLVDVGEMTVLCADHERPPVRLPVELEPHSIAHAPDGSFWVGVGDEVLRYVPSNDLPETRVLNEIDALSVGESRRLYVVGVDHMRPLSWGRNFAVSYRAGSDPWSEFEPLAGPLMIAGLGSGSHRIEVRVMNEAGRVDLTPALVELQVHPLPIQARPWFVPLVATVLATILVLAAVSLAAGVRLRRQARNLEQAVRQRTAELGASEHKYRTLFEDSQDAICLFDSDGVLVDRNDAASDLLGYAETSIFKLFVNDHDEQYLMRELATSGSVRGQRVSLRGANERRREVLLAANLQRAPDGRPKGFQVILHDVTQEAQLEERVRQSHKMEALGRMAGGVAHDFNNILTVIHGYAEMMLASVQDDGQAEDVSTILESTRRAMVLTGQIQTFSRTMAVDARVLDLGSLLTDLLDGLRHVVPDSIDLQTEFAPDSGRALIDPSQFEQVVLNLVINARQAMPDGGKLWMRSWRRDIVGALAARLGLSRDGSHAVLQVLDDGIGMDPETLGRAFDPFFTTKPPGQGTGLGLAIVYGIVQQAGGSIHIESEPGAGTSVTVYLPHSDEPVTQPEDDASPPLVVEGHGTLLVVDDEERIRELARRTLEGCGYEVLVADDGAEALAILEEIEGDVDAVVSDIVMPELDGIGLAHVVREKWPGIRILLTSGYPRTPGGDSEIAALDATLLTKPFRPAELARRVNELLERDATTATEV